tara:strand:- start:9 stop:389 length:381 start_codon:yes stop_codon:yes gene_type:complete
MNDLTEKDFQSGIRATEWFKEYVQEYGEEPNLNIKEYDYRKAWAAGVRPTRDKYDVSSKTKKARYHWGSSAPDGTMLKSKDHPTAWKEQFMVKTGVNPDAVGVKGPLDGEEWIQKRRAKAVKRVTK